MSHGASTMIEEVRSRMKRCQMFHSLPEELCRLRVDVETPDMNQAQAYFYLVGQTSDCRPQSLLMRRQTSFRSRLARLCSPLQLVNTMQDGLKRCRGCYSGHISRVLTLRSASHVGSNIVQAAGKCSRQIGSFNSLCVMMFQLSILMPARLQPPRSWARLSRSSVDTTPARLFTNTTRAFNRPFFKGPFLIDTYAMDVESSSVRV
ncbi:hypothetical protein F5Y18DRAFT_387411 [Xylariaceae sp. FL1019]|nr:hypothetical protein F5Y18DRAFT_387411 [Xylariaceae sp. FL1019]